MNDKRIPDPHLEDTSKTPPPTEQMSAHGPHDTSYDRPAQPYEHHASPYGQTTQMSPVERESGPQQQVQPPTPSGLELDRASILLRIGGWIEIVFGALTILTSFFIIFMRDSMPAFLRTQDLETATEMLGEMSGVMTALAVVDIVVGLLIIWFGITAIRHHRDDQKVTFLYVVGIVLVVLAVIGLAGGIGITSLVGLIGAICYFLGARYKRNHYSVM